MKNGVGIHLHDGAEASGSATFVNDTVADNVSYGIQLDDLGGGSLKAIINSIVYFNNPMGSYVQQGGNDSIATAAIIERNDWQLLSPLGDNIESDPLFVNMAGRDFHLDEESPCVDEGDDTPRVGVAVSEYDFESDDRQQDGDGDSDSEVDIGADEFTPE